MFYYIPQIILFLCLGLIVFVVARNISGEEKSKEEKKVFKNVSVEKVDAKFNNLLEKILRKIRIAVMKFDGLLQKAVESVKESGKPKSIFKVEEVEKTTPPDEEDIDEEIEEALEDIEEEFEELEEDSDDDEK